jgi:hypothetical protein
MSRINWRSVFFISLPIGTHGAIGLESGMPYSELTGLLLAALVGLILLEWATTRRRQFAIKQCRLRERPTEVEIAAA